MRKLNKLVVYVKLGFGYLHCRARDLDRDGYRQRLLERKRHLSLGRQCRGLPAVAAEAAVPAPAPTAAPIAAPEPPSAMAPIKAPKAAAPPTFFAVSFDSDAPCTA